MSVCIFHISGLTSHPEDLSDALCGARDHVIALADKYAATKVFYAWNDQTAAYVMLKALIKSGVQVLLSGHSHGAWRARVFLEQLKQDLGLRLFPNLAIALIDECPFGNPFECLPPPEDFPRGAAFSYACWQHQPDPECWIMPKGVDFYPRDTVTVDDVTGWTNPRLGHIDWKDWGNKTDFRSIAGDDRVWARVAECYDKLLAA